MIAVETIAVAARQNTVIKGISTCDEDTNNDQTAAVLFDMTSAPAPLKGNLHFNKKITLNHRK